MGINKLKNNLQDIQMDNQDEEDSDSSESDVSMTDSDSDTEDLPNETQVDDDDTELNETQDNNEEEEDETIKAIRAEAEKKSNHPPPIHCEDFITDICFHPVEDIIAVSNLEGDVIFYKYTNDENSIIQTLELHTKACRDIEFSDDGKLLLSVSKDRSIMISDVASGKLSRFYENSHDVPLDCVRTIDDNLFATGDDDGCIKLWDLRQNSTNPIYRTKKNEDYITDMVTNEAKKYLVCSSADGSITTIDLQNRKIFMQSEEYEEELTCLGMLRSESKLIAGSSKGKLFLYNWSEFGLHSDEFPGNKSAINDLISITENIVVTACEDGILRAIHLFPNRYLGIVGQHDLSVEHLDISNNGQFIASTSHNNDIKFWNIKYFEDFEKIGAKHNKHQKKQELRNNLPSSKVQNASDFFSGLS